MTYRLHKVLHITPLASKHTNKQAEAGEELVCSGAPAARLVAQGTDQLAGSHQPLLTQVVLLLQTGQLSLCVCQLLLQGLHLVLHLPAAQQHAFTPSLLLLL